MEKENLSPNGNKFILFWPLICVVAGVCLWLFTELRIDSERTALGARAIKDSSSLSRVYAAYLNRSLEQMNQITMHVKSDWERLHGNLRLEDLKKDGLFTSSEFMAVLIIDRDGRPVTGTIPFDPQLNFADQEYFQFHRSHISTALRVSKPMAGRLNGKTAIYLTRRLDTGDDAFDGVVLIAVDPSYLVAFYDSSILGDFGMLAVYGGDGDLRASSIGGKTHPPERPALASLNTVRDSRLPRLIEDSNAFADMQPRYVAAQDLRAYPLTIMVGLSKPELFAPHEDSWATYRRFAMSGTVFLIFIAIAGSLFGWRLNRRENQALAVRKTYRVATEGANEGFYIMHPVLNEAGEAIDWELADSNERGAAFFGARREQFIGKRLSAVYTAALLQSTMEVFRVAQSAGVYEDEYKVPEDSPIKASWLHRRIVASETGLAITIRDISESKKSEQELLRLANEDAVTGLPNRHWLMRYLPLAMQRAGHARHMLAILFIDLDEFKNINDTLGHSAGDELLKIAAQRIKGVLRPSDKIVRLGGDEFTVIVEQVAAKMDTAHVAERIVHALRAPIDLAGGKHAVGASIGISVYPEDGTEPEILLKNADIAMYSVKANGKGHYQFFEPQLYESLKQRLNGEQALRRAIEQDHFILHYQPRVDTATGKMCGMEALVRWLDPERGMVPPMEFIPLAESTGLILPLGELVIDKACRQIAAWRRAGLPIVPVSINVSARQFNEDDVRTRLAAAIARHGIHADDIQVEITESAMMGEQAEIIAELAEIRAQGIELLVDDFGTGYSSLSQLQRLDMDALKVDRAFTMELDKTEEGQVFFKAIVSMAHALGMKVTAEGVETVQQLAILRSLFCDEVQGYFISRPVPAGDMEALLTKQFMFPPALRLAEASGIAESA